MNWTGPAELHSRLLRLWDEGELLRDAVRPHPQFPQRFPLRLSLKSPASADIADRFDAVRAWAADLATQEAIRIEWMELRHRVQGAQQLPACAWVDTIEQALAWLGKREDWERFKAQVATTQETHPALLPWLEKRPLRALALAGEWPRLLSVVNWLLAHPRPGIYLRQADVPGVHTKFVEAHRGVLIELLDIALPGHAVDPTQVGANQFAARYGFLDKPTLIRFRALDASMRTVPGITCPDITLDAESFSRVELAVKHVFITENETNFLAFPPVRDAIVIFGKGFGWNALARSHWLKRCAIHYWGDIDTHGFAILNQLRARFDNVTSFLMDSATLDAHAAFWGREETPTQAQLPRLTPQEMALYNDLRDNRIRVGLRLEQEHVGFRWLLQALELRLSV